MHTLFSKEDITRTTAVFEIFIELHVMLPFIGKYTKLLDIFFEIVVADVVDPPLPAAPLRPSGACTVIVFIVVTIVNNILRTRKRPVSG